MQRNKAETYIELRASKSRDQSEVFCCKISRVHHWYARRSVSLQFSVYMCVLLLQLNNLYVLLLFPPASLPTLLRHDCVICTVCVLLCVLGNVFCVCRCTCVCVCACVRDYVFYLQLPNSFMLRVTPFCSQT